MKGKMRSIRTVTKVKSLSTGYVLISCNDVSRYWGWGQLPEYLWDSLHSGQEVPDEYIFPNESPEIMPILMK